MQLARNVFFRILTLFCLHFCVCLNVRISIKMEEMKHLRSLIESGNRTEIRKLFDQKQLSVLKAIPDSFETNRLETDTISQLLIPEPRKRKVPARFEDGDAEAEFVSTVESHYRQIYYAAIDHMTCAITDRYDSQDFHTYLQSEQLLLKCVKGSTYETEFQTVTNFYGDDFHPKDLNSQLQALSANFESEKEKEDVTLSDIVKYFESTSIRNWLSEVSKLLQLVLIMPATNATSERSFSSLRRIKTYLRSTMTQNRLNNLMTLHVHRDYVDKLELQDIASEFIKRGQRITIFGKFESVTNE